MLYTEVLFAKSNKNSLLQGKVFKKISTMLNSKNESILKVKNTFPGRSVLLVSTQNFFIQLCNTGKQGRVLNSITNTATQAKLKKKIFQYLLKMIIFMKLESLYPTTSVLFRETKDLLTQPCIRKIFQKIYISNHSEKWAGKTLQKIVCIFSE